MLNKLILLSLAFVLVLELGLFFSGSHDNDDNANEEYAGSDDNVSISVCEYEFELTWLWEECTFQPDQAKNLDNFLEQCVQCFGECAATYPDDCNQAMNCVQKLCI